MLVTRSAHYSAPKTEATYSSEMSVDFHQTTRYSTPEDRTLHNHRCENLKSDTVYYMVTNFSEEIITSILRVEGTL
jgi:hypothetical protein